MTRLIAAAFAVCCLADCATVFKGTNELVMLTSEPPGAEVLIDGQRIGATPAEVALSVTKAHRVEFRAEGYQSISLSIEQSLGAGWVIADILLPIWLVNVIVDAATGAWFYLNDDHFHVILERSGAAPPSAGPSFERVPKAQPPPPNM